MIYGYARCSTNEEMQDITRQIRELEQLGCEKIFQEYESGIKTDRKQLKLLLDTIKQGDTLIALEVSRISRSTKQLLEIIELAKEVKFRFVVGSFVIDFTKDEQDPMMIGMLQMMGVFAEMERNIISNRVKSGLNNAKSKGVKLGRPSLTLETIPTVFFKHYPLYKSKKINASEFAKVCGCSRTTLYKYINIYEDN
jgi:DNA invertase Pin-like site-specific DNA recombinase